MVGVSHAKTILSYSPWSPNSTRKEYSLPSNQQADLINGHTIARAETGKCELIPEREREAWGGKGEGETQGWASLDSSNPLMYQHMPIMKKQSKVQGF